MKNLIKTAVIFLLLSLSLNAQIKLNEPDTLKNLALSEDVKISGSITNGRGKISDILYAPEKDNFATDSRFAEYGVAFGATDSLVLSFQWSSPKLINYITLGGCYPNQPQTQSTYSINILTNGQWLTIADGVGDWLNNGVFEWRVEQPIQADAVVVQLYGKSIHLRGLKDEKKTCLIQLLPYEKDETETETETENNVAAEIIKANTLLLEELVKMKSEIIVLKKKFDVLKERITNLHKQ